MVEDKLHRVERVRLEALALAVSSLPALSPSNPANRSDTIINRAAVFEKYIFSGKEDTKEISNG